MQRFTLGLNPSDIKYVIISHAHGDHDQGAAELQKRYGAQVVMGAPDWDATLARPATAPGGVPKRDIAVGSDGRQLTLGDTTVQIVPTPVRCPMSSRSEIAVGRDGRVFRRNADRRLWERRCTMGRIHRIAAEDCQGAADAGASVILSNHSEYDGAYTKARLIGAPRQPGEAHPFVVGTEGVQRYFTVMAECATTSKLRVGAQ